MTPLMSIILAICMFFSLGTSVVFTVLPSTIDSGSDYEYVIDADQTPVTPVPGLTSADLAGTAWIDEYDYGYYFSDDGTYLTDAFGYDGYRETEPGVYYYSYDGEMDTTYATTLSMEDGLLRVTTWDTDGCWWSDYMPLDMASVFGGSEWLDENDVLHTFNEDATVFASDAQQYDTTDRSCTFRISDRYMIMRHTAEDGTLTETVFNRNDIHELLGGTSWLAPDGMVYSFPEDAYSLISSDEVIWYNLIEDNLYWRSVMTDESSTEEELGDEAFYDYRITCEGDELVIRSFDFDGSPVGEERFTRVTE